MDVYEPEGLPLSYCRVSVVRPRVSVRVVVAMPPLGGVTVVRSPPYAVDVVQRLVPMA